MDVVRLIYLYVEKYKFFFGISLLRKNSGLLHDMDAICKECLWIKCVFASKFSCIPLENKRSLCYNSVPKKVIPLKNNTLGFQN